MTKRETEILNKIKNILNKYLKPNILILFGSRARQEYSGNADFDIALDSQKVDIRLQRKIMEDIEEVAGLYKVDIVYLNSTDKVFRDIILKTGRIIYERST